MNKYSDLAKTIIKHVGGVQNVNSLTHCITRLRFKLKDEKKANTDLLKATEGIVTVMISAGQYQVVIGNHVPEVYEAVCEEGHFSQTNEEVTEKLSPGAAIIDAISGIFQPTLGVLSAVGILKGVLALLVFLELMDDTSHTYGLLYSIADGFFYFLPLMLAYTASKKFKGNKFIGMAIAASLCYPAMVNLGNQEVLGTLFEGSIFQTNYYSTFFGIPVLLPASGYPSSVIPIIAAVFFSAKLEKFFKKVVPTIFKAFFVPLLTLIIITPLTYLLIGPITTFLSSLISALFASLYDFSGLLAGGLLGGVWQILVIFGLHWALVPLALMELGLQGSTTVLSPTFGASFAQSAVVLALILKNRDKNFRTIALPAFISGMFGITEPCIYGITLPRKKPFVISCIAAAVSGAIIAEAGVTAYRTGGLGLFGLPNYINPETNSISGVIWSLLAVIVAMSIAFLLTMFFYKEKVVAANTFDSGKDTYISPKKSSDVRVSEQILFSPLNGLVKDLNEVPDDAFSGGALGRGIAIMPEEGKVYSPCDGVISVFFNTNHAIGMKTEFGAEILIHVGMDTVNLDGRHFTPKANEGDWVTKGQLLLEFDLKKIEDEGYSVITPVVVTNSEEYADISFLTDQTVSAGDPVMRLKTVSS